MKNGRLIPELAELAPKGNARLGANPHANGGLLLKDLRLPVSASTVFRWSRARPRPRI